MEPKIQEIVDCAIDRLNELLPTDEELSKDKATLLLGKDGRLDSMAFVNLLVALEEELDVKLGIRTSLADELMTTEGALSVGDLFTVVDRVVRKGRADGGLAASETKSE